MSAHITGTGHLTTIIGKLTPAASSSKIRALFYEVIRCPKLKFLTQTIHRIWQCYFTSQGRSRNEDAQRYLESIVVLPQQQVQQQQQHQQQQRDQQPGPVLTAEQIREAERQYLENEKRRKEQEFKNDLPGQSAFAQQAVAEVEKKAPMFTLPAYKALEEYKTCVSSDYPSFMCLVAFMITLASIIMPFTNSHGKDK